MSASTKPVAFKTSSFSMSSGSSTVEGMRASQSAASSFIGNFVPPLFVAAVDFMTSGGPRRVKSGTVGYGWYQLVTTPKGTAACAGKSTPAVKSGRSLLRGLVGTAEVVGRVE